MSDRYDTDAVAWDARIDANVRRMQETCDRIIANCGRIDAMLQATLDHLEGKRPLEGRPMPEERDKDIKTMTESMSDELRFCKDCKWFRAGDYTPTCAHPTSVLRTGPNLVTGKTPPPRPRTCESAPWGFGDLRGQDGQHWEPAEVGFA